MKDTVEELYKITKLIQDYCIYQQCDSFHTYLILTYKLYLQTAFCCYICATCKHPFIQLSFLVSSSLRHHITDSGQEQLLFQWLLRATSEVTMEIEATLVTQKPQTLGKVILHFSVYVHLDIHLASLGEMPLICHFWCR